MKTRSLRIAILFFCGALFTSVFFQNCSKIVFTDTSAVLASSCSVGSNGECLESTFTESFLVSSSKTTEPLDMVWVVDNSGSMSSEAQNVRMNISNFINFLDTASDMKLLILSRYGDTGTNVALPSGLDPARFMQINQTISSINGPSVFLNELSQLNSAGTPFFRDSSKKIIVFVTDDESALSAANFSAGLGAVNAEQASVFGFVGLGNSMSPCQARTGTVYQSLADSTGGHYYNICDVDWSQHFSDLKTNVLTKLHFSFTLSDKSAAQVLKVEIDGVLIDPSLYSFINGVLSVNSQVNLSENSTVAVVYTH